MSGRPIRFLGGVLALWTLGRIAFLLPAQPEEVLAGLMPKAKAAAPIRVARSAQTALADPARVRQTSLSRAVPDVAHASPIERKLPAQPVPPPPSEPDAAAENVMTAFPSDRVIPTLPRIARPPDRWSTSVWAIARRGGGALLPGGQLGGSQAGMRVLRRIDRKGDLAASVRLSTPWDGIGREAALGLDWKPVPGVPVRLIVEHRLPLDDGQSGTAVFAVTGFGPQAIAPRVTLTAYAQAGAVARDRVEPFADGAVRAVAALTPVIDLGLGAWGGAQRDAQRLDVGPTLGIAVPLAERRVRLSLDWRHRVAGRAAPNSGPAITLAGDF